MTTTSSDYSHYTVEGEPGTWTTHTTLPDAIERAKSIGVSTVWGVRYTTTRRGITGVDKRVVWSAAA